MNNPSIYFGAMNAVKIDDQLRAYYQKKTDEKALKKILRDLVFT